MRKYARLIQSAVNLTVAADDIRPLLPEKLKALLAELEASVRAATPLALKKERVRREIISAARAYAAEYGLDEAVFILPTQVDDIAIRYRVSRKTVKTQAVELKICTVYPVQPENPILAALREAVVDGVVPFGTFSAVSRKTGKTVERVRQVASANGIQLGPRPEAASGTAVA